MDISILLDRLVPNAKYSGSLTDGTEDSYNNLVWTDTITKPTWAALQAEDIIFQKEVLVNHLADYRWQKETGGIIFNAVPIRTDDRSKMLLAAIQKEIDDLGAPTHVRKVKTVAGFLDLPDSTLTALYLEVIGHTQKCFDAEYATLLKINDNTLTDIAGVESEFDTQYAAL